MWELANKNVKAAILIHPPQGKSILTEKTEALRSIKRTKWKLYKWEKSREKNDLTSTSTKEHEHWITDFPRKKITQIRKISNYNKRKISRHSASLAPNSKQNTKPRLKCLIILSPEILCKLSWFISEKHSDSLWFVEYRILKNAGLPEVHLVQVLVL